MNIKVMNGLQKFSNPSFGDIRAIEINCLPYFVGRDVASCLGYSKPRNAILQHVDNEDALKWGIPDNQGFIQNTTVINESGVYSLIFGSKLPAAKEFKRWVTKEVLPSIRKTGTYSVSADTQALLVANDKIEEYEKYIKELKKENIQNLLFGLNNELNALNYELNICVLKTEYKRVKIIFNKIIEIRKKVKKLIKLENKL